jgi:hypothetical protein
MAQGKGSMCKGKRNSSMLFVDGGGNCFQNGNSSTGGCPQKYQPLCEKEQIIKQNKIKMFLTANTI